MGTAPASLETLAAAHAETGDFETALEFQKKALAADKDGALSEEAKARVKLYEMKKPFRETPSKPKKD